MSRRSMLPLALTTAIAFACAAVFGGGSAAGQADPSAPPVQLLPDLDQQTPNGLTIASTGGKQPQFALGFQSAVRNIGTGPLIITGARASTKTPTMHATQLINSSDGTQAAVRTPSRMRYAISPTHRHWHLLRFDRYTLRPAGGGRAVVRDQKTGFCLGDRYRVQSLVVAAAPATPFYTGGCAMRQPNRLTVTEGISPGYGDNYLPHLEGQSLSLSGLPAGHYVLIHRANADHALQESNYANDSASLLLDLSWHATGPQVTVLASCPDTDRCDAQEQAQAKAHASGSDAPPGKHCVTAEEARLHPAGDAPPPKFSAAFYRLTFTMNVSLDGADGRNLPISIEEVCGIPKARAKEAVQLAGAGGVAIIYRTTKVFQGRTLVTGPAIATAIDGADTATLTVRLAHPKSWRADEDGSSVPTVKASRIDITD